nr:MAG TPA: hypothetical protein [Bacteriophage sp.]
MTNNTFADKTLNHTQLSVYIYRKQREKQQSML